MENNYVNEARTALASIDDARLAAAQRLTTPWWYHPVLGLLAAVFVVAYTTGGPVTMVVVGIVYFVGIGILVGVYKAKNGVWINGLMAGKASWWTVPLMLIMIACLGSAYYLHTAMGLHWPAWLAAAIVFLAINVFGRRFDMALRAQLREKA